jgi:hypothetical protein
MWHIIIITCLYFNDFKASNISFLHTCKHSLWNHEFLQHGDAIVLLDDHVSTLHIQMAHDNVALDDVMPDDVVQGDMAVPHGVCRGLCSSQ